jgi:hypothetical protein
MDDAEGWVSVARKALFGVGACRGEARGRGCRGVVSEGLTSELALAQPGGGHAPLHPPRSTLEGLWYACAGFVAVKEVPAARW